ncbi:unnamed protein product [Thlaspi arvense]|uniref:Tyrosine specific protein phosphatases domain-containing protein n=1 Tax=Thlaspi arvense TaxID=13288 RepID=A0AAU9S0R1_THLAR|nr:unnamed protein product [Thlaspi arvense]
MSVIGSKSYLFSLTGYSRENEKSSWLNSINKSSIDTRFPRNLGKAAAVSCKISGSGVGENPGPKGVSLSSKNKMEDYNTAMKRLMRSPYEYHHDLGMNYTLIRDELIAKDFDPLSLRSQLPKAVSSLEWAVSEGKGRVYVHCTAGLGRAPAVSIAYMYWFCDMNLNTAYDTLVSKRQCGPNKGAIRGATYDLAKNDPWKEPFENLPENAFEDIADWERKLIQERVRAIRGT